MALKNQGGGPWGSGGGQGPSGGGGGPQAPDIEEIIRKGQDKFRSLVAGCIGGGRGMLLILLIGLVFWAFSFWAFFFVFIFFGILVFGLFIFFYLIF